LLVQIVRVIQGCVKKERFKFVDYKSTPKCTHAFHSPAKP
jgi:hypothetical protein